MIAPPDLISSASAGLAPPRPRGLARGHFRRVAARGFGDGHNSYAYGYAWFNDHLYVGTNRDLLVMARKRFRFEIPTTVWPVETPRQDDPATAGGEIWRYSPVDDEWVRVYKSPLTDGLEGRRVPVAAGFRNMLVFQGASDARPALYTIPSCGSFGRGPVMLRSEDGEHFEQVSEPGLGLGDPNVTAFRSLVAFRGRMFMTPAGSRGGDPNVSYHASILASDDPLRGAWQRTNVGGFGDPSNYGIYDMCVAGEYLYAGTMNIRHGCQVWKTKAEGDPPFDWIKVFDRGADRAGYFNQGAVCITAMGDDVYLGTGIQNGGYDRMNNIGPGAAEVIRIRPDDSWDLVVGEPRMTRQGLKVPTSGYGPGFDNVFAGYMWRMCTHEGCLYVGTYDSSAMFPFARFTDHDRWVLDPATLEQFMRYRGGCELWRSDDGDHWQPVTRNGFGNPYNWGIRTLISTPAGLFVGTANPFGPRVAMGGIEGWRYVDNPQGGIEVWHGRPEHAGHEAVGLFTDRPALPIAIDDGSGPDEALAAEAAPWPEAEFRRAMESAAAGAAGGGDVLEEVWDSVDVVDMQDSVDMQHGIDAPQSVDMHSSELSEQSVPRPRHNAARTAAESEIPWSTQPAARLSLDEAQQAPPADDVEAEIAGFYAGTTIRAVGYWRSDLSTPHEASRALVDELLALLPADDPLACVDAADSGRAAPPTGSTAGSAAAAGTPAAGSASAAGAAAIGSPVIGSVAPPHIAAPPRVLVVSPGAPEAAELVRLRLPEAQVDWCTADAFAAWIARRADDHPAATERASTASTATAARSGAVANSSQAASMAAAARGQRRTAPLDLLLWIEGPSRGERAACLRMASRLLAADGRLLAADLVGADRAQAAKLGGLTPGTSRRLAEYEADLAAAGFDRTKLFDVTSRSWFRFTYASRQYFTAKLLLHHLDRERLTEILTALPGGASIVDSYFVLYAAKSGAAGWGETVPR